MPQFALDAGVRARNAVTDAVGAPALPSWTKTLVLRDTGRIFAGESGTITLGGSTYTYDEIRKMSAEMGIMEDTLRSELGPDLQKTLKRGRASRRRDAEFVRELRAANPKITDEEIEAAKAARSDFDKYLPGRAIGAMADAWRVNEDWVTRSVELMEQRVRMELFLEGLHMGMNPQQAGRLVDEALYDWSSPMTQLEVMSIARWVPFYRVFRNSGAHAMRMLTEPFTTPDFGDYTRRAMMGQTQMGRTRAMWRFQQFYGWETDADPNRPGRQPRSEMEPGTLLMPRWVSSKTPAKVVGAPMEDQMWFVERKGAVKDQLTIAHPNNAALEAVEMVTSGIMFGTAAAIVAMDNAGHLAGLTGGRTALPADWMARLGDLAANYVGIATPEIIKAATGSGRPVELSDAEATMLRSFGIEPRPTEDGRLTTAPLVKDVMRYIPFVGPQVLDVFKAMYDRPLSDEDGEALVQIMGHVVGLQRKYYSGQSEEYGRRVEDARRAMSTYGMPVKDPRGLDQK